MPFLGQDWRSPGEQWVKTTEGWERLRMWRLKLLENLNENVIERLLKLSPGMDSQQALSHHQQISPPSSQPHIHIRKVSKEQKMQTSITDALSRLDMGGAVKDIRRFNYVCKMMELLIRHKLSSLSGTAQKHVMNTLEEVLSQVCKTHNNVHVMRHLLEDLRVALQHGQYDHVGSSSLWKRHLQMVERMQNEVNSIQIKQREEDGGLTMSDLPDACIRHILLQLSDGKDVIRAGMTDVRNSDIAEESRVWKDLCLFHFDNEQLNCVMKKNENLDNLTAKSWKVLYLRLVKRFGMRDVYAEMLHLCRHCNALFWNLHGHPCLVPDAEPKSIPVTPVMCMELFTV